MITTVVVPTYNEAENIERFLRSVRSLNPGVHVLVVDDLSPDGTGEIAESVAQEIGGIEVMHREGPRGLGNAYRAGFERALDLGSDVVVSMDDDFSHDPAAIGSLVDALASASGSRVPHMVIGSRYVTGGAVGNWPFHRRMLSRWGNRYTAWMLGLDIGDCTSGFRAYNAAALEAIDPSDTTAEGYAFLTELVRRATESGVRILEIPITFVDRLNGRSKMSLKIVAESMQVVTGWGLAGRRSGRISGDGASSRNQPDEWSAFDRLIGSGLGAACLSLGALRAGDTGYWRDEAFSAVVANTSATELLQLLWREAGMGPFYIALWVWQVFGSSDWWLRMLPVAGGALAVAWLYFLGRALFGRSIAFAACVGLFCNPFFLRHLTELRSYSWVMFLSVFSTWAYWRLRSSPRLPRAVAYGVSTGLLLAVHPFAVFLILLHVAMSRRLCSSRQGRKALLVAGVLAVALVAPFARAMLTSTQLSWIPELTSNDFRTATRQFLGGRTSGIVLLIGCCCLTLIIAANWTRTRLGTDPVACLLVLGCAGALPVGLAILSTYSPSYVNRYLVPSLPFVVLAATAGFVGLAALALPANKSDSGQLTAAAALLVAYVVIFPGALTTDLARPEDLRSGARLLDEGVLAGDAVIFGTHPAYGNHRVIRTYWNDRFSADIELEPDSDWRFGPTARTPDEVDELLSARCRVWFVGADSTLQVSDLPIEIERGLAQSAVSSFGEYSITLFDRCR